MKKLLTKIACLTMVVASGLTLAACGMNTHIMANRTATLGEGESAVQYSNTSSFALDYKGDNTYKAKGEANSMTQEQADAFWKGEAKEGDNFVVLSIDFAAGEKIVYGFDREGADFENPDGTQVKKVENTSNEADALDLILRIKQDGPKNFKVISNEKDKDAVTYTVDFSDVKFPSEK